MAITATVALATLAISTSTVTNSIGVNTHIDFAKYGYQSLTLTAASINYLGLKNLRDSPGNDGDVASWRRIADATGAKFIAYMREGSPAGDEEDLARVPALAAQGILNYIEGGNENDDAYALSQGNSIASTAKFQQRVFAVGRSLRLPVINMSFGSGWTAANDWRGNYDKVGDLSPFADYANAHTYPLPKQLPEATMRRLNDDARLAASSRPVITTEIGWDNKSFNEAETARFALDAVFDGIKLGNTKTYFYALFDDGSGQFGLMRQDGTAKPAGMAIHNLMAILADNGQAGTGSLAFGVSGATDNDNALLMRKSNGAFELALWNEKDPAHSVTLNLAAVAQTINVYDPLTGPSAAHIASNTRAATVTVPDHPIVVEIVTADAAR
jgi:hypothetical protein